MLENRFLISADYVELECDNFDTFSNEYALLLQSIGSELDTFLRYSVGLILLIENRLMIMQTRFYRQTLK